MAHEFNGKKYEKASAHQKEWGVKIISELDLQGHEHVLDLGCGDGTLTAEISEKLPKGIVVGIDASQGMLEAALPKTKANLQFLLVDINNLTYFNEFDIIYSNATLHWIKDHKRLLKNVHRALHVGGRIRFNFAADGNCSYFYKVIREAMALKEFKDFFTNFNWPWYMPSIDEYRTLVEHSEFQQSRVWEETADRYFANEDAMIRWIDQPSIVPFLVHVISRDKEAFREYVVRRMIEETKQNDGRCFETFRRVNVTAVKEYIGSDLHC